MGSYVGKCEEEEVVDVKIRTRAMRKVRVASTTPYNVYELTSRRHRRNNSISSPTSCRMTETTTFQDIGNCTSSITGSDVIVSSSEFPPLSCCLSNNTASFASLSSTEFVKNVITTTSEIAANPEAENGGEASSKFSDCGITARGVETKKVEQEEMDGQNYPATKPTVQIKPMMMMMPSKSEIEDFFSSAEKDLQKRFSDKYNFDIVKDVPLEGRFEWIQIKQ